MYLYSRPVTQTTTTTTRTRTTTTKKDSTLTTNEPKETTPSKDPTKLSTNTTEDTGTSTTTDKTIIPIVESKYWTTAYKKNYSSLENRTHNYSFFSGYHCIENINKTKVWGTTNDGKVILENFVEGKSQQLWKKGEPDDEGYFTLENFKGTKVITAISESGVEIKGKITLRWILLVRWSFLDYLPCIFTHRSVQQTMLKWRRLHEWTWMCWSDTV